jgi:hypothetical protein
MLNASGKVLAERIPIFDFSKIEAGELELDPIPFALRDSFSAIVKARGDAAVRRTGGETRRR